MRIPRVERLEFFDRQGLKDLVRDLEKSARCLEEEKRSAARELIRTAVFLLRGREGVVFEVSKMVAEAVEDIFGGEAGDHEQGR